jgi:hypothetical protein
MPAEAINVALGSNVALNGSFFSDDGIWAPGVISPAARIVSGVLATEGTPWNQDGVWWNGNVYPNNSITIVLPGALVINSFFVQADDNDTYRVSYLDSGNNWQTAYDVPYQFSFGLVTRSEFVLSSPIETSSLKVEAINGDGFYSVSQIIVIGQSPNTVPEPSTFLLLGAGLGGLALLRRKVKKQ